MRRSGFGIIGLGRFGTALAMVLSQAGEDVIVIDKDEDKLRGVKNYVQEAFLVDTLTREALEECGIGECSIVVVCIGQRVDVSVLTTLHVLNLGVPRVIAKADSHEHGIILERIGAEVVHPESETATRLAAVLLGSKAMDIMKLNGDYIISEIKVTENLYGKKLTELELEKYDLKLVALEYEPNKTIIDFEPDEILEKEDAIVVAGKFTDVERFEHRVVNDE